MAELNTNHGGDFDWIGIVLQAIEVDTIKIAAPYGDQFRYGWKKCKEDYKVLKLAVKGVKPLLRVKKLVRASNIWSEGLKSIGKISKMHRI